MTDRYAFRYNEFKIKQIEKDKLFDYAEKTPLLSDIGSRMQGIAFAKGISNLDFLGIRVKSNDENLFPLMEDASDYGVDALRIALLENKLPLTHDQKSAGWKLADKIWLALRDLPLTNFDDLKQPLFYPFILSLQKKDWKEAWIRLKTVLNQKKLPILAYCIYPFMPHLVQTIHSDIHSKMASFWLFIQKIAIPPCYFIQINGHLIMEFYPTNKTDFEKIKKEALSFTAVQNKIKGKEVKKVIHINGKGLNFVV